MDERFFFFYFADRAAPLLTHIPLPAPMRKMLAIQISTVVVSTIGGTTLFYKTGNTCYLGGALMMAVILPYTRVLLYPINDSLLGIRKHGQGRDESSVEEMLIRWDMIHFGRTLLSYGAMVLTLYGALTGKYKTIV